MPPGSGGGRAGLRFPRSEIRRDREPATLGRATMAVAAAAGRVVGEGVARGLLWGGGAEDGDGGGGGSRRWLCQFREAKQKKLMLNQIKGLVNKQSSTNLHIYFHPKFTSFVAVNQRSLMPHNFIRSNRQYCDPNVDMAQLKMFLDLFLGNCWKR
jgi:hypothetical protein